MNFNIKDLPTTLISTIYTNAGPRGDWHNLGAAQKQKCLASGPFGLMPYKEYVNIFLDKVGLPRAEFILQSEYSDNLKEYFVLRIETTIYNDKILPVQSKDQIEALTLIARECFKGIFAKDAETFQKQLITHLFTNEGPRGDWRSVLGNDSMVEKCLDVGIGELISNIEAVNKVLVRIELPEAIFSKQREAGLIKNYLVLRITREQYVEKIVHVPQNPELINEMQEIARTIFIDTKI